MASAPDLWDKAKFTWSSVFWNAQIIWECGGFCKPDQDLNLLGDAISAIGKKVASGDELKDHIPDLISIAALLALHGDPANPKLPDDVIEAIRLRQSTFFRAHLDKLKAA